MTEMAELETVRPATLKPKVKRSGGVILQFC